MFEKKHSSLPSNDKSFTQFHPKGYMSFTQFHPFKDPFVSDVRLPANKESRFPWGFFVWNQEYFD